MGKPRAEKSYRQNKSFSEAERNLKKMMEDIKPFVEPETTRRGPVIQKWKASGGTRPILNE